MDTDELRRYVRHARLAGKNSQEITKDLLLAGWQETDIQQALTETQLAEVETGLQPPSRLVRLLTHPVVTLLLIAIAAAFGAITIYLWQDRLDLAETNSQRVRDFYTRLAESQIAFTDAGKMVFPDEQEFITKKSEFVKNETDFMEADLRTMRLTLYEKGVASTTMPILTKGKERSWWETPTGDYTVLSKSSVGYSSIGNVWMPYAIQFYGNYMIHGWPYHDDGVPVPQGYSGGCIRLSTDDAKIVFDFAHVGMPILVLEDNEVPKYGTLMPASADLAPPTVNAKAFLVANLATGETVLEKNAEDPLPIASLTKLMTAVVAHEVIYLGRPIKVRPDMLASVAQVFYPEVGERYIGLDLLYPLLMQSSNDSANVLAGFLGEKTFVRDMNMKALSLEMQDTRFADPSGISADNISSSADLAKLLQYIYYKRPFLFDITRGVAFDNVGVIKIGDTIPVSDLANVNEFVGDPDLIGIKNGETTAARQTMATVWNIRTAGGDVPVAIVVLGSDDRKEDTAALLSWLKANFEVL